MKNLVLLFTFVVCLWLTKAHDMTTVSPDNDDLMLDVTPGGEGDVVTEGPPGDDDDVVTGEPPIPEDEIMIAEPPDNEGDNVTAEAPVYDEGFVTAEEYNVTMVPPTEEGSEDGGESLATVFKPFQWPHGWCYYRCPKRVSYRQSYWSTCGRRRCRKYRIRYRMVQSSCRRCCRGFRYDRRTRRCVDINECLRPGRVCSHICINTPGSYFCMCRHGFQLVGGRYCKDIDECKCNMHYCPPPYHCFNTYGSYMCHCPHGFKPNGNWCYWMSRGKSRNAVPGKPSVIPKFEQVKKQQLKPITKSKP